MPRPLLRPSWTCLRCLTRRQQLGGRRSLSSVATAASSILLHPDKSVLNAPSLARDDSNLRQVFDSRPFWDDFSKSRRASGARQNVGLFQNHHLTSPRGFEDFAHVTLEKCRRLVAKVLGISTLEGYKGVVKDLDRLSDLLCRIIDLADFVRSTHPDPAFQYAAGRAHALMFEYMNTLNTTTGLNEQLKTALANPEVTAAWSEEEMKVAHILRKDFEQSAIDLPAAERQRFVEISNTVSELGSRFQEEMQAAQPYLRLDAARLKGVSPTMLRGLMDRRGRAVVPTVGSAASLVLRYAEDEETRRQVYIASRTASDRQVQVLEELLQARAELASLSGFESYGRMTLTDKMARTPEAVIKFLEALAADNAPNIRDEISRMLALKTQKQGHSSTSPNQINAWDREYYRARLAEASTRPSRTPDELAAYFSLGTVMQGLSRLFTRLYGVRFVPAEPQPGETWTPDVRRLDVVDESEGLIAVIYCDLFARAGKSPNPAHFTLRCSRHISADEIAEAPSFSSSSASSSSSSSSSFPLTAIANDGMATVVHADGTASQLPTIALICDFPPPSARSPGTPPLLPLPQLTTLFHEMGHAIHSCLGRTALQNVAGTRCATDFAELPSVLGERFATHPAVLRLYARHWQTDRPLPPALLASLQPSGTGNNSGNGIASSAAARAADAADTEAQVRLALLDQAFHARPADGGNGGNGGNGGWNTDEALWAVDGRYAAVPEPREARWQGFFGHLVGYGGSYYAYLFDRAIAGRVWDVVFDRRGNGDEKGGGGGVGWDGEGDGPVRREAGERYRREVLRWGGSRDGWACVAGVLGEEEGGGGKGLEGGGEAAMATVGRWGVGLRG